MINDCDRADLCKDLENASTRAIDRAHLSSQPLTVAPHTGSVITAIPMPEDRRHREFLQWIAVSRNRPDGFGLFN
jgi:hypothetical protein